MAKAEKLFTPATLAERWDCSERHVRNLIRQEKLPAFRVGEKLLRIKLEDVEAFECPPQNGRSDDTAEHSASSSTEQAAGTVTRLEPMTRARLGKLRPVSTPN